MHAQALHDLRNLFSRLSGTTGIARAYAVRLTDGRDLADIAFQLADGRVLLEAVPSTGKFGECFGTVGGLIAGLDGLGGHALLDAAGDGWVLSSLHARSGTRVYAKTITAGRSDATLSDEETDAVRQALV